MLNIELFSSCQEINNLKRLNIKIFIILIVKKKLHSKIDRNFKSFPISNQYRLYFKYKCFYTKNSIYSCKLFNYTIILFIFLSTVVISHFIRVYDISSIHLTNLTSFKICYSSKSLYLYLIFLTIYIKLDLNFRFKIRFNVRLNISKCFKICLFQNCLKQS